MEKHFRDLGNQNLKTLEVQLLLEFLGVGKQPYSAFSLQGRKLSYFLLGISQLEKECFIIWGEQRRLIRSLLTLLAPLPFLLPMEGEEPGGGGGGREGMNKQSCTN